MSWDHKIESDLPDQKERIKMTEKTRQSSTHSLQEPASPTKKVDFVKGHRRNFSAAPRLEKTPFTHYKLQRPTVTVSVSTAQDTKDLNLTLEPSNVVIGHNVSIGQDTNDLDETRLTDIPNLPELPELSVVQETQKRASSEPPKEKESNGAQVWKILFIQGLLEFIWTEGWSRPIIKPRPSIALVVLVL